MVVQAVEEQGEDANNDEFGGGVLQKRQKAARHEQQSDGETADLQQVNSLSTVRFHSLCPDILKPLLFIGLSFQSAPPTCLGAWS